jgi:hypothetical protein
VMTRAQIETLLGVAGEMRAKARQMSTQTAFDAVLEVESDLEEWADKIEAVAIKQGPFVTCGGCGVDLTNWPTASAAHTCKP